jgi:hypothetical protein
LDITSDGGAGRNHAKPSESGSAHDGGVGTDGGAILDVSLGDRPLSGKRSRDEIVGERGRRADKYVVPDGDPMKHVHIVLNFAAAPDDGHRVDEHVLPEDAMLTQASAGAHVTVMPDLRAFADDRAALDHCSLMREVG